MLFEQTIRQALSPDPLEVAKAKVQTRAIKAEIERRRALVHASLALCVPTEGRSSSCGRQVAS